MANNSVTDGKAEQANEAVSVVQGSPEPEINTHKRTYRLPMIYKLLGGCVVLILLGYFGFKLYGLYKDETADEPVAKAPESSVTSAKRRADLGQNTQFFEKEVVATTSDGKTAEGMTAGKGGTPQTPAAPLHFQKYLSIAAHDGSSSTSPPTDSASSSVPTQTSEAPSTDKGAHADSGADAVKSMKVESIAMDPNLYIEENTYIPCSLLYRFVSDVAGRISCVISEDVYSANGKVKLIEKGTKAFGWYKTGTLNQGQAHMAVLFSELRTRDFKKVSLIDTQATGQLGESGISGWVDEHFWDRFKGALMLALVQTSGDVVSNNGLKKDQNTDYTANSREAIAEMSNTALENSINIPPTIYKNQGDIIGIMVGRDIDFSGVYTVRLKK
ncbi:putative conjugal transfer protein TriI [Pseudomonas syringae pv. actinidiae ICMP 19071]|uniref:VirB10/TraB/TrbI family type IV secretion system protein n=1 Tax=Pseudomonas syringae group TaxID=136849 RepID=UPI000357C1E6|nr:MULTISPECIES: VirB10/TraB/TrbI family type IV secretion system protein [Pseudomonas syringae group]EPM53379.1 putative conjugal transfer protein TriI [Pseudomonas syringae pv. actinidiae ICMP 19071]EPM73838.1 putative conjugal transfer protein TriI [Pseudomonas syringae pv. actinidiae ICMP 19072]RMS10843.1 hypothetical protein ALP75_205459 [Pseudomonas syringae pv. actinidiae]RMV34455.1 hypothetical protein ALP12_200364 [Pseudomonas savastanoi pv. phaseolicola]